MRTMLVIGGSGFIGGRIVSEAVRRGHAVVWTYRQRKPMLPGTAVAVDLAHPDEVGNCVRAGAPDVVIYTATAPLSATLPEHRIAGGRGAWKILQALRDVRPDALFCFLSTNAVFGDAGPHTEEKQPTPGERQDGLCSYACSKAEAEQMVRQDWKHHVVARVATVNGRTASGELSRRLRESVDTLLAGRPLARFTDRVISPTLVDDVVDAVLELAEPDSPCRGVVHLAGCDRLSDFDYTRRLAAVLGVDPALVLPDSMAATPAMAGSPADTALDCTRTRRCLRTVLRGVDEQLRAVFG